MTRRWLGTVAVWAGRLLAVAALVFLARALSGQWGAIAGRGLSPWLWASVAGLGLGYGALLMLVAEAWHRLLVDIAARRLARPLTWPSYAITQIAKYLPGNVFQYVGRVAWLGRRGVPPGPVVRGMVWEVFALVAAALLMAAVLLIAFPGALSALTPAMARSLRLAAIAVLAITAVAALVRRRAGDARLPDWPGLATLAGVIAILMAFFLGQAAIFTSLAAVVSGRLVPALLTVSILAWVIGFVTPGAPAGVGVREAAILLASSPFLAPADAVLAAALFRLVTTFGDAVCAGIGWLIVRRAAPVLASSRAAPLEPM